MTDWTSGYVADVGYTFGYYSELQPQRLGLTFLHAGLAAPVVADACELGFGQGLSTNIHAAASGTRWWGTDFNPAHAGFAQELANVSGAGAKLYDESFAEFAARTDLPEFDFIALHGIWSWVSEENRRTIVDFIRRRLKVGGVVYVSYNTLPGWAVMLPIRHLLTRHADTLSPAGAGIVKRIDSALDFGEALLKLNPIYGRAHPQAGERLAQMKKQNRHYLAHEYFNRDWMPMHFLEMADWMEQAKLAFACSAAYQDHVDMVNFNPEQQAFMRELPDPRFREAVRDFMVNTQFRRDYWVRGARQLTSIERSEGLRAHRLMLVSPRESVTLKVGTPLGEAGLNEEIYNPILDALAKHKPMTIGQIEKAISKSKVNFGQLLQAVMILIGKGDIDSVQDDETVAAARPRCDRLNRHLMVRARGNGDVAQLASPMTGGGITVARFEQVFLLTMQQGLKTPEEIAASVWQVLKSQGQRIVRDGAPIEGDDESLRHLQGQVERFQRERLPILKALQVA